MKDEKAVMLFVKSYQAVALWIPLSLQSVHLEIAEGRAAIFQTEKFLEHKGGI